jgi:hypothetical protein
MKHMLKERLTRNRVIILTIMVQIFVNCFILLPLYKYHYCARFPPGEYYDSRAAVVFSGVNQNGLVACPWVLNETDGSVVEENQEFKDYFTEDFAAELQSYPLLTGFKITYTGGRHEFNKELQTNPNHTPFDPYYINIYIDYDSTTRSNNNQWNDKIAPALEVTFREKWYVSKFMIVLTKRP